MNRFSHELNRQLRFEPGQVSGADLANPDLTTPGRQYPRTQAANTLAEELSHGQRAVILSGGDNDYPVTIGISPWVT